MSVEWRAVPGWEGLYEVSNDGRIRSLPKTQVRYSQGVRQEVHWKGRELKPSLRNGYPSVQFRDRRAERVYIHRVVCEVFNGPPPVGCDCAHNDGSRTNNIPLNLRWASRLENMQDKAAHGMQPQGEAIYCAKLTNAKVVDIRRSSETLKTLAKRHGVSPSAIRDVRVGRTWRHIERAA